MGTREIKSPEGGQETPGTAKLGGTSADSIRRKKLGIYFMESDDGRTAFGRGYTGGTTPVNIHGKPIPDLSKTGGWTAAFFIFGMHTLLCTVEMFSASVWRCYMYIFHLSRK